MRPTTTSISLTLIVLLASLNALVAAAIDMYLPAFPAIGADLAISAGQVQQTLTIFLLGLAVGQGFYGPLLDRFGRRNPMLVGISLFTLGSLLAALAHSFEMLLVARFIQALGAAAGSVTPRAIIADTCDVPDAARAFSMLMQVMMIAPITAPIIGSAVLLLGPWQMIFWVLAGAGLLAGAFSLRLLPETLAPDKRIPISARNILRNYFKLLSHRRYLLYTLASGFLVGGLFTYISNSPFVFIEHFGLSPAHYSLIFGASACGMIVSSQVNLRLLKRRKPLYVLFLGLFGYIALAAALTLLVFFDAATAWSYAILLGLCLSMLGLITGNLTAVTMSYARDFAGIASSLMGVMQFLLAGVLGLLINLTPTTLYTLPLSLLSFSSTALLLAYTATHINTRGHKTNTMTPD